jgi:hypothetical protein
VLYASHSSPQLIKGSFMSAVTRKPLPLILVRGFGGLDVEDEKRIAYQGFNDGTVYPRKRGENYIYEGFILRFMKSAWKYQDATNVIGYFPSPVTDKPQQIPTELSHLDAKFFHGNKVIVDPAMALHLTKTAADPCRTLWVFRYYDLDDRNFEVYGEALVRLISFIRALAKQTSGEAPKVNIIAHSMGGLLVREAVQVTYPKGEAEEHINKIVTLGTPHQGISFQMLQNWMKVDAEKELEHFNPKFQANKNKPESFHNFGSRFPLDRLLTIVGTNYRSYDVGVASKLNRFFSVGGEGGPNYNRSDGLVKQTFAQIPGAPRTFVHKCHGGFDSLVTARESFEAATRFFFGNVRVRLKLVKAKITRGKDFFGKSEFFFGVSIKPRRVDFDLFHQSAEAENCYGPFNKEDLSDPNPSFGWAGKDRTIWEGYLDTSSILADPSITTKDMVMRLDFYVGERDLFGVGFSDNVIFRKQYYVRALLGSPFRMYLHTGEEFMTATAAEIEPNKMKAVGKGWEFEINGTGFEGTLKIEIDNVPEVGDPTPITPKG